MMLCREPLRGVGGRGTERLSNLLKVTQLRCVGAASEAG